MVTTSSTARDSPEPSACSDSSARRVRLLTRMATEMVHVPPLLTFDVPTIDQGGGRPDSGTYPFSVLCRGSFTL